MNDKNLLPDKDLTGLLEHEAGKIDANLDLWPAIERQLKLSQSATQPLPENTSPLLDYEASPARPKPLFTLPRVTKFALGIAAVLALAFVISAALLPGIGIPSIPQPPLAAGVSPAVPAATPTPHVVTGTLKATLTGPNEAVGALAWKADGSQLAGASDDASLITWDANGKLLSNGGMPGITPPLGWPYQVYWLNSGVGFESGNAQFTSPDRKLTAYRVSGDKFVLQKTMGVASGESNTPLATVMPGTPSQIPVVASLSVPGGSIGQLAWSPDGKTIVGEGFAPHGSGSAGPADVRVWFWRTDGTLIATLDDFYYPINSLAWSPDGKKVAISAKGAQHAGIWSPEGKLITKLPGDYVIWQLAWSPDGNTLAAACSDDLVRLWSGDPLTETNLTGHQDSVEAVAWSPDGKTLASGSGDKTVKLWTIK